MRKIFTVAVMALATLPVMADEQPETQPKQAENEKAVFEKYNIQSAQLKHESPAIDMENGVLGIADDRGFTLQSKDGRFIFKPYLFMQTRLNLNYYDDEGLDKAYNQDNVANSGFSIPGFHGQDIRPSGL